jgi:hypothetical protein
MNRGEGYDDGSNNGHADGFDEGPQEAYKEGRREAYEEGHNDGFVAGNSIGYDMGIQEGLDSASALRYHQAQMEMRRLQIGRFKCLMPTSALISCSIGAQMRPWSCSLELRRLRDPTLRDGWMEPSGRWKISWIP